ncbi:MAG: hypothetical protein AAFN70_12735, partial [Planctomycetota bacterium]
MGHGYRMRGYSEGMMAKTMGYQGIVPEQRHTPRSFPGKSLQARLARYDDLKSRVRDASLTEHSLLPSAIEHDENDSTARRRRLDRLTHQLDCTIHELPSGFSYDYDSATTSQCREMLAELNDSMYRSEIPGVADWSPNGRFTTTLMLNTRRTDVAFPSAQTISRRTVTPNMLHYIRSSNPDEWQAKFKAIREAFLESLDECLQPYSVVDCRACDAEGQPVGWRFEWTDVAMVLREDGTVEDAKYYLRNMINQGMRVAFAGNVDPDRLTLWVTVWEIPSRQPDHAMWPTGVSPVFE